MKANPKPLVLLAMVPLCGLLAYLLWPASPARASDGASRKVIHYQDSMHPWVKSDQPGKCTICGMDLTPIREGDQGFSISNNLVVLSSNAITVLNVQAEEVKRQAVSRTLRVAGTLEANEARKAVVSAPARGRIEDAAFGYAGVEVEKGQRLITFFSPDLVALRRVLPLANFANRGTNVEEMRNFPAEPNTAYLFAPLSGVVLERAVYNGQYVGEGERLLTIADSSVLWFRFDVYEQQLAWLEPGQTIEVTVPAVPGKVFPAVISFIEPTVNDATRTVRVRADLPNAVVATNGHPRRLLRFGMYADGRVRTRIPNTLAVPRTAILYPGVSTYAYVDKGDGAYERRRVKLGRQGDDLWEVLDGLDEGERVVSSGNVLIDAQAQLNQGSNPEMGEADKMGLAEPQAGQGQTVATITPPGGVCEDQEMTAVSKKMKPVMHTLPTDASLATMNQAVSGKIPAVTDGESQPFALISFRKAHNAILAAAKDELWRARMSAMAEADGQKPAAVPPPGETKVQSAQAPATEQNVPVAATEASQTNAANAAGPAPAQPQALTEFVGEADSVSQALAKDDLGQFNRHAAQVIAMLPKLKTELPAPHRSADLIKRLSTLGQGQPAKDLAQARSRFLPFSTAWVELVKQLRKEDPGFAGLKIYHCPMAPKPGLWMQAKGPLANPFYGAEMLRCGEEIRP